MSEKSERDFFRYEDCDLCGDCLYRCRYLNLGREEAVNEMKRLRAGEPTRVVHKNA